MHEDDISFTVSAPGKVILIGEHSVLYKKRGIASSINKRTFLQFKEHREAHEQITFHLKTMTDVIEWDFKSVYNLTMLDKPLNCNINEFSICTPQHLNHEAFVELIHDFVKQKVIEEGPKLNAVTGIFYIILGMLWCTDVDITPFDLELSSDLTIGAGTGSSASYSVCIAAAIYHYIRLKAAQKHGSGVFNISSERFKPHSMKLSQHYCGFSSEEKEIVNKWAFCVEKIMHGTPSGLDNTVCAFGNTVLINSSNLAPKLQVVDNFPSFRILLINTGVARSTAKMVNIVSTLHRLCREPAESILAAMDVIALEFTKHAQSLKEITHNEEALQVYRRLEALIDLQHGLLRTLGVSHPRLDEICMITLRRGLHSKLTGAGGGGYAYTLIPPDATEQCIRECIVDLKSSGFYVDDVIVNGEETHRVTGHS